jgi:hypothetical protein
MSGSSRTLWLERRGFRSKTKKLRGKAIVRGGAGTATRIVGLLGNILTYAVDRDSRKAALARFLKRASGDDQQAVKEERRLAAEAAAPTLSLKLSSSEKLSKR